MLSELKGIASLSVEDARARRARCRPRVRPRAPWPASTSGWPVVRPTARGLRPKPAVLQFVLEQIQKVRALGRQDLPDGHVPASLWSSPRWPTGSRHRCWAAGWPRPSAGALPSNGRAAELACRWAWPHPSSASAQLDLTRRALSAAQAGASRLGRSPASGAAASTIVTVDRPLTPRSTASGLSCTFQSIHRRNVYRFGDRGLGIMSAIGTKHQASLDGTEWPGWRPLDSPLTVLIADPMGSQLRLSRTGRHHCGLDRRAPRMPDGDGCGLARQHAGPRRERGRPRPGGAGPRRWVDEPLARLVVQRRGASWPV